MKEKEKLSEEEKLRQKVEKNLEEAKSNILYFYDKSMHYAEEMSSWITEKTTKNRIIHHSKNVQKRDKELVRRRRGRVYYIDLGVGVGSELSYPHFCVVIKEFTYTALIVPISSIKNNKEQPWKSEENAYIEIGKIQGLPNEGTPDSYAVIGHLQSVSKQRLSYYKHNGKYLKDLRLSPEQMDLIDQAIIDITTKPKKEQKTEKERDLNE